MSNGLRLTTAFGLMAVLMLSGCGASKPKPEPLESFTASTRITTVWQQRDGSVEGPSMLVVRHGGVTTANTSGDIFQLDLKTGQERWRANAKERLSAMVGSDGRYAAVVTDSNELLVFDQSKLLWRERLPGRVITAPLVAGERVFIQSVDRSVRGYDVKDGRWLWQYQRPGGDPLALASSGVISAYDDTLLVGQGAHLIALDPTKGTVRFDTIIGTPRGSNEVERLADLIGPLARINRQVCVRAFQLSVACVDAANGNVRWSRAQAGIQAVASSDNAVYGSDASSRLSAWKADNGDLLWRVDRFMNRGLSAPVVWGNKVAVADHEGYLNVLSGTDGRTLARMELDGPLAAVPEVSNDLLLVLTRRGTVYALRAN